MKSQSKLDIRVRVTKKMITMLVLLSGVVSAFKAGDKVKVDASRLALHGAVGTVTTNTTTDDAKTNVRVTVGEGCMVKIEDISGIQKPEEFKAAEGKTLPFQNSQLKLHKEVEKPIIWINTHTSKDGKWVLQHPETNEKKNVTDISDND
jgi:hypothetical protein